MTRKVLFLSIVITYVLMVFGGIVTSTGSGLGCPDWPLCHGQLLPFQLKEEIPTPPAPMVVETKLQPWIEQTHRILGAVAGLLMLASLVLVWKNFLGFPRKAMVWIFLFLILEALLGMRVVLTEAPLLKEFLHYVYTTSHLILSVLILSGLTFAYFSVAERVEEEPKIPFAEPLYVLVMFQILVGILVRYVKAADFNVFAYFFHITYAMGLIIFTLYIMLKKFDRYTFVTFLLVAGQVVAGIATVITKLFLPVLFFHIAIGFLLVIWLSYMVAPAVLKNKFVMGREVQVEGA
ncbi:cytochrome c oxidase assembly protein subunit 15 [Hydrogenivirga caldilitoris]|uniref:Cytochrome c oxidase assembly protein subunit 15 n=1 Tax=Hydrogenivirga caldilitoris TaxID=246264 RepID=A0A497XUF5_9AQUI|nr:COX15/CtaA family protein [Hydrogenivirga caldilitoris]RLJ70533.1 cytochrome c oxidase assembly protein subunit 15 [Hydrogenivirga caldilitoris]